MHIYAPMGHLVSPFSKLLHFVYVPPRYSLQATPDVVDDVKRETEAVKSNITVNYALQNLRQLLSRPSGEFDVHLAIVALEHLPDIARENGDEHAPRYNAILKQTRGLFGNQGIQRILLKLLGTKEEIATAKEIEKATINSNPLSLTLFSSHVFNG